MRMITVAGPPSAGKTAVIVKTARHLLAEGLKVGVVKFDALSTADDEVFTRAGIPATIGLSGRVCPDHFFVSNVDDCRRWGEEQEFDVLLSESAGLCNRCSPHVEGMLAVCVVDTLAGIHTPRKIGPMLRFADVVVVTKGDIVSQAEREVFIHNIRRANARAAIIAFNGLTGQGALQLSHHVKSARETADLEGRRLRFSMPSAVCPYCVGETAIGRDHQRGNVRKMSFADDHPGEEGTA